MQIIHHLFNVHSLQKGNNHIEKVIGIRPHTHCVHKKI
jgi:hypothetical protein